MAVMTAIKPLMPTTVYSHQEVKDRVDKLRHCPPHVGLRGYASHRDDEGGVVNSYQGLWYLQYSSWYDVSGPIADLEKYRTARLNVQCDFIPADRPSNDALEGVRQRIVEYVKDKDDTHGCDQVGMIKASECEFEDTASFFVSGENGSRPWHASWSWLIVCSLSGLGFVFRYHFYKRCTSLNYRLRKEFCIKA